jgi:NAD(P)-dependent dehydrogenase (short-subunit alcohol dehydrogenase family)
MDGKGVIVIAGYGIGISRAVALKFGKERGYTVAVLARTQSKLETAAQELNAIGVKAQGFPVDLNDPKAVVKTMGEVQASLGEVSILFWNGALNPKKG